MATGTYAPQPIWTGFNDNGDPLNGGLLYTYAAGTTTPLATYSDVGLTTANANPVVLDSAGRCTLFLSASSYKFVLKTSAGVTVVTRDNVGSVPSANVDTDVTGTAGEALSATKAAYLLASTWFLADADAAASSTAPPIGFVVLDIANGASGTFRTAGRMTGFSGLTPGSDYYVSATAGEITSTAPTNARYAGRADSISSLIISPNPRPSAAPAPPCGRLTLTTGVPVTTADVTAATTVYWTPYAGNVVGLYTGTTWVSVTSAQLSVAVPATTSQMYDVFVDYNDGTPALAVLAWTNDTTRATALTTQDGVYVKTGDTQQRYVGSFRTTGVSGQTEDSNAKRYVWNYYNRKARPMSVFETTDSWTYTTTTIRQANGNAANQLDMVIGVSEDTVDATVTAASSNGTVGSSRATTIGLDATNARASSSTMARTSTDGASAETLTAVAAFTGFVDIGRHILTWLEWSSAGGTTTWVGDNGGAAGVAQSGIRGVVWG